MSPELETLDRLLDPIRNCLTPEVAKNIAALRADVAVQARIDELAEKNAEGVATALERTELENYVHAASLISVLQAKARAVLAATSET